MYLSYTFRWPSEELHPAEMVTLKITHCHCKVIVSPKEGTHFKGQENVPKLEVDVCLLNQNQERKFSTISRNGEGSRIRSQGNTSDRHTITLFHREKSGK